MKANSNVTKGLTGSYGDIEWLMCDEGYVLSFDTSERITALTCSDDQTWQPDLLCTRKSVCLFVCLQARKI